jgi:hypothetical protein
MFTEMPVANKFVARTNARVANPIALPLFRGLRYARSWYSGLYTWPRMNAS